MATDLLMGSVAVLIAALLAANSARLASLLQEGDDRWREEHPWVQSFEPQVGPLATELGRWWILRTWLLIAALGFAVTGTGLVGRVLL